MYNAQNSGEGERYNETCRSGFNRESRFHMMATSVVKTAPT